MRRGQPVTSLLVHLRSAAVSLGSWLVLHAAFVDDFHLPPTLVVWAVEHLSDIMRIQEA